VEEFGFKPGLKTYLTGNQFKRNRSSV